MSHARLSPSHSATWLTCPGALTLSAGIEDKGSKFAAEGSAAHELAARCLTLDMDAVDFLHTEITESGSTFLVDEEMCRYVQIYLDVVRAELADGELFVEQRVDLSAWYGEEGGGTSDAIVFDRDSGLLGIIDLKYGKGVEVSAMHNTQLLIYAAGAYAFAKTQGFTPTHIRMVISQPRVSAIPSVESISVAQLNDWVRDVLVPGAKATREQTDVYNPSDKGCQWCKAKAICPALAADSFSVVGVATVDEFQDLSAPPAPIEMDDATLAVVLSKSALVRKWLDAVDAEALQRAQSGKEIAGHKLVRGRAGNAKWEGDEEAIARVLEENYGLAKESIYKMELISPTQMQKLPVVKDKGADLLKPFISRSEGAICLAPLSDKRDAVVPGDTIAAEFTVLID